MRVGTSASLSAAQRRDHRRRRNWGRCQEPAAPLDPDLLDGDLFGGIIHRYRGHHLCDVEFAARQDYVLAWINDDGGRGPGCKSVRGDADAISSWFETFEFKESVVVRHHRAWISGDGTLKNDGGASNGVVAHVRYSAGNTSCRLLGCIDVLCRQRCGHRNRG